MKLLKEAISEFDTSKSVDVKGPMLDPILSYQGGGELPTHKDAASILERYYFQEEEDKGVSVNEDTLAADNNEVDAIPGKEPKATRKDVEDELTKEGEEVADDEEAVSEQEEEEVEAPAEEEPAEVEQEGDTAVVDLENSVIEKLIGEMEEEEGEEEEVETESEDVAEAELGSDIKGDPDKHATGAGTEQAGTGDANKEVPDRKESNTKGVAEDESVVEQEDEAEEKEEEDEEKDLDVEVKKEGALLKSRTRNDYEDALDAGVEEAFQIFKEQIVDEEEEAPEMDSDEVTV